MYKTQVSKANYFCLKVWFRHFSCDVMTTSRTVNFFSHLQGDIAMAICTKWATEVQQDMPKALGATMNLKPTILIPYFSLLNSRYNCVNDGGVFGSGFRKKKEFGV